MRAPSADALTHFAERTASTRGFGVPGDPPVRYRLMRPADDDPSMLYPFVIFLHGAGERGDDNTSQLLYLPEVLARPECRKRYPCYMLAVQCAADDKWVEVEWGQTDWTPPHTVSRAMRRLQAAAAAVVAQQRIDEDRIYLTGLSMGGFGCWQWAGAQPEAFAAVAPLCGGGDVDDAADLARLPIWAVHGTLDDAVPVAHSRRMIEAIRAAGGKPKYTELTDVGHDCWTPAYEPAFGLLDWMFAQRRNS